MKRRLLAGLLAAVLSLQAFADGLPDLGDPASADLSPQMERRIGIQIAREIRFAEPTYLDDPELEDYLQRLGARLVAASQDPAQNLRFFVLKDRSINAAAMLGGVLVFNTGLFTASQSESEFASVMAHEISHVQQRHMSRMVAQQQNLGYAMIASLLLAILAGRAGGDATGAVAAAGQAAVASAQLAYSRDFEREADRVGLQMLTAAGFDSRGMVSFFERLDRATRLYDNNAFAYLRTHPLTTDRVTDASNRVLQIPYRQVVDSVDFVLARAKIDALDAQPNEVLARYAGEPPQRALAAAAHWYARARAALRLNDPAAAESEFAQLRKLGLASPMIELLDADIRRASGKTQEAQARLAEARSRYPQSRALLYAHIDALLALGKAKEAGRIAAEAVRADPFDDRVHSLAARAAAAQGRRLAQHRAQAETYYLRGALLAAIEQLQLGLRAGDGDYFEKASAEARLSEFRQLRLELIRERQR